MVFVACYVYSLPFWEQTDDSCALSFSIREASLNEYTLMLVKISSPFGSYDPNVPFTGSGLTAAPSTDHTNNRYYS
jgi:hypothetical protein